MFPRKSLQEFLPQFFKWYVPFRGVSLKVPTGIFFGIFLDVSLDSSQGNLFQSFLFGNSFWSSFRFFFLINLWKFFPKFLRIVLRRSSGNGFRTSRMRCYDSFEIPSGVFPGISSRVIPRFKWIGNSIGFLWKVLLHFFSIFFLKFKRKFLQTIFQEIL